MAQEMKDDKLDEADEQVKAKSKSGLIKIVLIVVGVLALIGVNIGVTLLLVGGGSTPPAPAAATDGAGDHGAPADAHGKSAEGGQGDGKSADGKTAQYYAFDPAFVVNFQAQETIRFLQVKVEVMARDPKVIEAVERHMPVIRNNLIVLFSSQDFTTISTRVGKERLRAQTLAEIQKVLKENTGQPGVEAVYFTSFVMQ